MTSLFEYLKELILFPFAAFSLRRARRLIVESSSFIEHDEIDIISRLLIDSTNKIHFKNRPKVFFDVGANVGIYTELFRREDFKVLAIEANKDIALKLRSENIFSNVSVYNCAISSGYESLLFYQHYDHGLSSLKGTNTEQVKEVYEIDCYPLDHFIYLTPLFIKVDVEGAELDVLKGMARILDYVKPICLFEVESKDIVLFSEFFDPKNYGEVRLFCKSFSQSFVDFFELITFIQEKKLEGRVNLLVYPIWLSNGLCNI